MTKEEAIERLKTMMWEHATNPCPDRTAFDMAISALEQKPICPSAGIDCEDCPAYEKKMGHCKDCKHFEYDSVAKVDGVPLIVAHEICSRWGDGCKTSENGYCFLFEPKEDKA